MKCNNCPAMWAERSIMTSCGEELGEYGCLIRGRGYGGEYEYCYRGSAKVNAQLEELKAYAVGRIKRPKWVLQRFLHDLTSQMDTVQCGLPGFPPLWQPRREGETFDNEYCIEVKPLYGGTDLYYDKCHAYEQGYKDAQEGKKCDPHRHYGAQQKEGDLFE